MKIYATFVCLSFEIYKFIFLNKRPRDFSFHHVVLLVKLTSTGTISWLALTGTAACTQERVFSLPAAPISCAQARQVTSLTRRPALCTTSVRRGWRTGTPARRGCSGTWPSTCVTGRRVWTVRLIRATRRFLRYLRSRRRRAGLSLSLDKKQ